MNGEPHNDFWRINAGHILALLLGVAAQAIIMFVAYGRFSEKMDQYQENEKVMQSHIQTLDENGTHYSQKGIQLDHSLLIEHERQIIDFNHALVDFAVVKTKIEVMADDMKELKARGKGNNQPSP